MNDMTEAGVVEEELRREGPGRRLCEAREAKRLSLEDVAGRLRMHVKLVRAMEADEYDALPPSAFVVGYLRNYSRLLELPAQEILDAYKSCRSDPPRLADVQSAREVHGGGGKGVRVFTWVVIITLLVLLGLWWQQGGGLWLTSKLYEAPAAVPAPTTTPAEPTSDAGGADEIVPTVPWVVESMDAVPEVDTAPDEAGAVAIAEAKPAPTVAVVPEPSLLKTAPELTLVFEGDSWTRVTDADGERLVADLVRKGQTRALTGKAPFELTLGYAPGVVVQYNGVVYDHSRFHARNIARFTVGSADDNPTAE